MKNIRDVKCTHLSKKQMGIISGGAKYNCYTYNRITGDSSDVFTMNFDSPQDLLNWYNSLPWGTIGACTKADIAQDNWNRNPGINDFGF
ncbi:MAG TPA: hypothetical protein IAB87_08555 [Candidatus Coprenecus merdipullorum]|nr:hypothetical protein [Candidatus Coprenecus merdipullorum]